MPDAQRRDKEEHRLSGDAHSPQAKVPTYQELLDETLENTFPASDPIAASAAMHVHEPHTSARDERDWTLEPGACQPAGQAGGATGRVDCEGTEERAVATSATLLQPLRVDTGTGSVQIPAVACEIEQTVHEATLRWQEGGKQRGVTVPLAQLRAWLADGVIRRDEPA